jgi:1-phosphatidylinositol-4-phosphate 5-kinase
MKNLGRSSKACVMKIYDLKGSSYDREVIKKGMNMDLSKVVMKDLDFLKLEK